MYALSFVRIPAFFLIFFLTALTHGSPVSAQETMVSKPNEILHGSEHCTIKIDGPIGAQVVSETIREIDDTISQQFSSFERVRDGAHYMFDAEIILCLNSTGGLLSEANRLVQHMLNLYGRSPIDNFPEASEDTVSIATVVDKGDICLSACALIFMAGSNCSWWGCTPNRHLHPTGVIGFHAPDLVFDAGGSEETIRTAYRSALLDFVSILQANEKLSASGQPYTFSMIQHMLKHSGDEYYYVDQLGEDIALNINLLGPIRHPENFEYELKERALIFACDNAYLKNQIERPLDLTGELEYEKTSDPMELGPAVFIELSEASGGRVVLYVANAVGAPDPWSQCFIDVASNFGDTDYLIVGDNKWPKEVYVSPSQIYATYRGQGEDQSQTFMTTSSDQLETVVSNFELETVWELLSDDLPSETYWIFWPRDSYLADMAAD